MKTITTKILFSAFSSIALALTANAQLISFSDTDFDIEGTFTTFPTTSQNSTSTTAVGTAADTLAGTFLTVDLTNLTTITFIGSVAVNPGSSFSIEFYDSNFNVATYIGGSWNQVNSGGSTVLTFSTSAAGFDPADVSALMLNSGGSPADSLNFTAVSIVPEPATYAAIFGVLALAFVAYRRRRA